MVTKVDDRLTKRYNIRCVTCFPDKSNISIVDVMFDVKLLHFLFKKNGDISSENIKC